MKSKLTVKQRREITALAIRPEQRIDTSDIKALDTKFWAQAVRNPFYRPVKQSTTVRVDADVLAWLKSQGKGYQTRINSILREAMLAQSSSKR
jgi:uncharacterized protein (DUF4415 family)